MHMMCYLQISKLNAIGGQKSFKYGGDLEPSMLPW